MKKYCFGVDVGGTTVKIGFLKTDGTMLDKWEIKTNTENAGELILEDICKALDEKLAEAEIGFEEIEGVGIGLYLTRQMIEKQDGYVKVESAPGKGSTFSLFLPRE